MVKTVLVVAAHTDDEALGCAGTIIRHVEQGDAVHLLFMTDGTGARSDDHSQVIERKEMAQRAADIMGVSTLTQFSFPDNRMDTIALLDIVQSIEGKIEELQPECVYTHHTGDLNIDHQITHRAVITACRPQPGFCVKEIYCFEVPSSTEWNTPGESSFHPNHFVDINLVIEKKLDVINTYKKEMRHFPHSRSIKNIEIIARNRGASVGLPASEAFMTIRTII